MKELQNITIYRCDFCKKELKRKHAMQRHEERCMRNPIHNRPCFGCNHLERKSIEYDSGQTEYTSGEHIYRRTEGFFCAAKQILLLHPKTQFFERLGDLSFVFVEEKETEQFEMPKQCNEFSNNYEPIAP